MSREKIRVLVADDEAMLRGVIEEDLLRIGCEVTLVGNGDDALQKAHNDDFDVVLLDIRMPRKDGMEVLQSIREMDSPPEVLIMTAHATVETALQAMNEDFADIVVGPEIKSIEPTPEELADDDCVEMPRIAFGFNRRDYGRLRQLIDVLNRL